MEEKRRQRSGKGRRRDKREGVRSCLSREGQRVRTGERKKRDRKRESRLERKQEIHLPLRKWGGWKWKSLFFKGQGTQVIDQAGRLYRYL